MTTYHKIDSVWKRDQKTGAFLSEFSTPEFEFLAPCEWDWSEKAHGTNIRVGWTSFEKEPPGRFVVERHIRGRTDRAQLHSGLLERLHELFPEETLREAFGEKSDTCVVLYGEGIGPGINDSRLSPDGYDFVLFDVRIGRWWLTRENVANVASKFGVQVAPTVGSGSIPEAVELVREGFESRLASAAPGTPAEGLVLRPRLELFMRNGSRIITKLKTADFRK